MIWRLVKDLLISGLMSVFLLAGACVGLLDDGARGSYEVRPNYKIRARETTRQLIEFILLPIARPGDLVPDAIESAPVIGPASVGAATVISFPPCFCMVVAFMALRLNRRFKVFTSRKFFDQLDTKYGYLFRRCKKARRSG